MKQEFFDKVDISLSEAIEAVKVRRSVRNFTGRQLPDDVRRRLESLVALPLLTGREEAFGTYGVIRNAASFIQVPAGRNEMESRDIAARMELVVLWLTAKGLGTCWLGGTFHNVPGKAEVQALIAVGETAARQHLLSRITSALARSTTRLPMAKLFQIDTPGIFEPALELVRLAPSALNKQPWRAVQSGNTLHLYCKGGDSYRPLDMGIAMAHFELLAPEGRWVSLPDLPDTAGATYYVSYRCK